LLGTDLDLLLLRDAAPRRHPHHRGYCRTRSKSSHEL
jgi:hypothetical protein